MKTYRIWIAMCLVVLLAAGCPRKGAAPSDAVDAADQGQAAGRIAEQNADDVEIIKTTLAQQYNLSADDVEIEVETRTPSHMRGTAALPSRDESGLFLAARETGSWTVLYDGTDTVSCEQIEPYNFPKNMVADCVSDRAEHKECGAEYKKIRFNSEGRYVSPVELGEELMDKLLNYHKEHKSCEQDWLRDYRIVNVEIVESKKKPLKVKITFSVQVPDGDNTGWTSGGGTNARDNWIQNKAWILTIEQDDETYKISGVENAAP